MQQHNKVDCEEYQTAKPEMAPGEIKYPFQKVEKIVLYLDDVSDMDEINVTKIFRIDKNLILDLLSSTRVMLVLKQAGNTWFELCRDPVNVGVIQVIEKSPPLNQLL